MWKGRSGRASQGQAPSWRCVGSSPGSGMRSVPRPTSWPGAKSHGGGRAPRTLCGSYSTSATLQS